jgi:hypothetical protein
MSAFYVGDDCITKCVTALLTLDSVQLDNAEQLGRELRAMNVAALRARYADRLHPSETETDYTFPGASNAAPVALWKALQCLAYQCNEGDVPETWPLYQRITEAAEDMQRRYRLDANSAAYNAASWGD